MGERIVSAEEARGLLDGASGPFSLWLPDTDSDWRIVARDAPMKRRRVVAKCGYAKEEAAMLAAAPDLARTVISATKALTAYRAFALRIATLLAPPDAVDVVRKRLAIGDLDALAETVAAMLEARAKNGRLAGLEEAAQVCEERMGDFANPAEIRARELSKTAAHIRSLAKATP